MSGRAIRIGALIFTGASWAIVIAGAYAVWRLVA